MRRPDRLKRRWTAALVLGLGFWLARCPSVAAPPPTLVVEQVAGRKWRADARGLVIEIRQETDGRLKIAFLGAAGEPVVPPPADAVTLSAAEGVRAHFGPIGLNWRSRDIAGTLADGDRLSIIEAGHRQDFQLNLHPADAQPPLGVSPR